MNAKPVLLKSKEMQAMIFYLTRPSEDVAKLMKELNKRTSKSILERSKKVN